MSSEFVGREDPCAKLSSWLLGEGTPSPLAIASISGPGGIGKSFLFQHTLAQGNLSNRNFLQLRLVGAEHPRSLAQLIAVDLPQSSTQLDPSGAGYFGQIRKCRVALEKIDREAREELDAALRTRPDLRDAVSELYRLGLVAQQLLPATRKKFDLSKVKPAHLDAVADILEKARSFRVEARWLSGLLPDVTGAGLRNNLRVRLEATLSDALVADLAAVLQSYRDMDFTKAMPSKVPGLDRLLLVIDDYESLQSELQTFLVDHFVPALAAAKFETLMVVIGRDRLSDTHPAWLRKHARRFAGDLALKALSPAETESLVRKNGLTDEAVVRRIVEETEGYPYLLASEIEAELHGGRSALSLKNFYDRTTQWMSERERGWFLPLCYLDAINEQSIAAMLPDESAAEVLAWFKSEASVRAPHAKQWTVLPIIRSRMREYVRNDSPARHAELERRAAAA